MLNGNDELLLTAVGRAYNSSSTVTFVTSFYDATGSVLRTDYDLAHTGASGMFGLTLLKESLPAGTITYESKLEVSGGAVVVSAVRVACILLGCPLPPDEGGTEDNGAHGCVECDRSCGEGVEAYSLEGWNCPPENICLPLCPEAEGVEDFEFQDGVVLRP